VSVAIPEAGSTCLFALQIGDCFVPRNDGNEVKSHLLVFYFLSRSILDLRISFINSSPDLVMELLPDILNTLYMINAKVPQHIKIESPIQLEFLSIISPLSLSLTANTITKEANIIRQAVMVRQII